ncbi:transcriptional regulator [Renibacterium salmoninarum ATCC 33209]|uniref:Transcriptional regulator n=1 Tax=Renibacterium salmoninarum (strain ATCC 33209 / DSM 20767 / JCM 11484 / NBRC 15589 / NCIMB 2235) TaxID=288705 RepID=A9WQ02_RENSM|nr:transcriptional regulator [Renibacterium salmoninarum ATCC 33209]
MSTQRGEMIINGDETTLAFVRQLPFPIETVWAAIADPEERAQWFGETILDGQVGGSIEMVPNGPPLSPERIKMT